MLDGNYSLTPSASLGVAILGYPFVVSGPVNLISAWGVDASTWVNMRFLSGYAALFGGVHQFGLSANTFGSDPIYVYEFSERPIGNCQIKFRSLLPSPNPSPFPLLWSLGVRIRAYNGATVVKTATEYNSDLSVPKDINAVKTVTMDCEGANVTKIAVFVEAAYSFTSTPDTTGYGIEITQFFIEDMSSGGGGGEPAANCIYAEDPAPSCGYSEDAPPSCTYAEDPATTCTYTED